ncbi:MAG: GtrA family protein [Dermatophilaceae bacterium]
MRAADSLRGADPRRRTDVGRVVRYLLVGAFSYAVNVALLVAFVDALGWNRPWAAAPAAFLLTFLVSYTLQRMVAFRSTAPVASSVLRYGTLVAVNTVAQAVLHALAERAGIGLATGQLIATGITSAWNYVAYCHWVYADAGRPSRDRGGVVIGAGGRRM